MICWGWFLDNEACRGYHIPFHSLLDDRECKSAGTTEMILALVDKYFDEYRESGGSLGRRAFLCRWLGSSGGVERVYVEEGLTPSWQQLGAWYCRLSCALQKANATSILQAGRVADGAGFGGATGWEEDPDDLLRQAAAYAAAGGTEA